MRKCFVELNRDTCHFMPFLPHRKVIMQLNMRSFESSANRDNSNYSELILMRRAAKFEFKMFWEDVSITIKMYT